MKKRIPVILIGIFLVILITIGFLYLFSKNEKKVLNSKKDSTSSNIVIDNEGSPVFVGSNEISSSVKNESDAYKALEELKDLYGFTDVKQEFNIKSIQESMGFKYYKLNQKYNNIPIYGKELVLSVDNDSKVLSITGHYYRDLKISNKKDLSIIEAEEKLKLLLNKSNIKVNDRKEYIYITDEENIYYSYIFTVLTENEYADYILNAEDGSLIETINLINNAHEIIKLKDINGVQQAIYLEYYPQYENVYHFVDNTRNIMIADAYGTPVNIGTDDDVNWINAIARYIQLEAEDKPFTIYKNNKGEFNYNQLINSDKDQKKIQNAVSAMVNFSKTHGYYSRVLERTSYNNGNAQIVANIGLQYDLISFDGENDHLNASWVGGSEEEFYFGSYKGKSFAAALDVVAHEFTHAVTDYISNLENRGESGALNESYSDILGSLIEGENFTLGEDIYIMRDMSNPNAYEDPMIKNGKYYFPVDTEKYTEAWKKDIMRIAEELGKPLEKWEDWDNGGVHTNSGVPNYAAYLMYKNGAFTDKEEMAKVWYNSQFLLTSTSNFEDCAIAVIQSAKMLGLKDDKVKIIENAFEETKMLEREYTSLDGTITDVDTKQGIELVVVTAISKKNVYINYTTQANENGNYVFEEIPAGEYTIVFEKAKYKSEEKEINLKADNKAKINISLKKLDESDIKASDIVFVLDISASMTESDPTDIRKQMIANVMSSLDDSAEVALVTFTKNSRIINNGLSYRKVNKKIMMTEIFNIVNDNGLTNNSGTNGRAGLNKALSLFNKNKDSRKYIVFFTDGEDTYDDGPSYAELISLANDMNVRILCVGLDASGTINQEELVRIAESTNGKYYYAKVSSDLYGFDSSIFEELE